tara:strand:- start:182 stop:466 length:285 start_codon:yes stop_codon:yes gene_type:complete
MGFGGFKVTMMNGRIDLLRSRSLLTAVFPLMGGGRYHPKSGKFTTIFVILFPEQGHFRSSTLQDRNDTSWIRSLSAFKRHLPILCLDQLALILM